MDAMWVFLAIFVVGIAVGAHTMCKLMGRLGRPSAPAQKNRGGTKTAVTQSMTTHTWWTENPRFRVQDDDGSRHVCDKND